MDNIATELRSIIRTRKIVDSMMWTIAAGAVLFSLMTGAPFVALHSQWKWTGWVLPSVVDAALILSLSADSILSRHGVKSGKWATAFRWVTGVASLFLNTWTSIDHGDWVGVAVHSIAPVILVCAAEVAPIYRRKFREVELGLTEQVTEMTVTKVVSKRRAQESTHPTDSLTNNQKAIRDGYIAGRKAAQVAEEIGVSSSYVYGQYRKIREELELTA